MAKIVQRDAMAADERAKAACDAVGEIQRAVRRQAPQKPEQPERNLGFDRVAERLARFLEVVSVYWVSGQYDLRLEVVGKSLQDVASFVSGTLSLQEGVKSTATYFLLKKYKEAGVNFTKETKHERLQIVP